MGVKGTDSTISTARRGVIIFYDFIYDIEDFDLFCKEMTDLGYKLNINCFIYQLSILLRNLATDLR